MTARDRFVVAGLATAVGMAVVPRVAAARTVHDEPYAPEQTWNASVRMLRVDMGFAITERDREAGFITFTYDDAGRHSPGSLQLVPTTVDGVAGTRIIVTLAQMPGYAESYLTTQLDRKLRAEYGVPTPAPTAPGAAPHDREHEHDHDGQDAEHDHPHEADRAPAGNPPREGHGEHPQQPAAPPVIHIRPAAPPTRPDA